LNLKEFSSPIAVDTNGNTNKMALGISSQNKTPGPSAAGTAHDVPVSTIARLDPNPALTRDPVGIDLT
jgi:hypothetical protein